MAGFASPRYERTQYGRWMTVMLGTATALLAVLLLTIEVNPVGVAVLMLMLLLTGEFSRMTVTVDDEAVRVRYALGIIRRSWPLAELVAADVIRAPWWYGMGIRWTPHGWLWNVRSGQAVRITTADGGRSAIGSDDAVRLAEAIRVGMGLR